MARKIVKVLIGKKIGRPAIFFHIQLSVIRNLVYQTYIIINCEETLKNQSVKMKVRSVGKSRLNLTKVKCKIDQVPSKIKKKQLQGLIHKGNMLTLQQ